MEKQFREDRERRAKEKKAKEPQSVAEWALENGIMSYEPIPAHFKKKDGDG